MIEWGYGNHSDNTNDSGSCDDGRALAERKENQVSEDMGYPIPQDVGTLYTLEAFVQSCNEGSFKDWEGVAYASDGSWYFPDKTLLPSDVRKGFYVLEYHFVWWVGSN